MKFRRKR